MFCLCSNLNLFLVFIVIIIGKWSDDSEVCVVHVVFMFMLLDMDVISGEVFGWFRAIGCLVCVLVLSIVWSEFKNMLAIVFPLWSSIYECHRVECAFMSPVIMVFCLCM